MGQHALVNRTGIILVSALITLGLFVFMAQLIHNPQPLSGQASEHPFHLRKTVNPNHLNPFRQGSALPLRVRAIYSSISTLRLLPPKCQPKPHSLPNRQ